MLTALRPSETCVSIQTRCGAQAEVVTETADGAPGSTRAGGQGGGFCGAGIPPERLPVHAGAPGDLALRHAGGQQSLNGDAQMRLQDVHSFPPSQRVRAKRNVPPSGASD